MRSSLSRPSNIRPLSLAGLMLVLVACGGGYQAPILEQGERQVVTAPIIVSSNTPQSSYRLETPVPANVSSSSADGSSRTGTASNSPRATVASTPAQSASPSSTPNSHRVRAGDTLFSIAFQYDLDFRSLAIANGLNPPYTIFVDREINLDLDKITAVGAGVSTSNLGTAVGNNSVARARAGSATSGSVLRQPVSAEPRVVSWQWPHSGRVIRGFSSGVSKGLDISGSVGDSVLAAGDGDVVYSGSGIQGSGDLIIIRHSDRYLSAYAHNSRMLVNEGARVSAGEKIAEVGENSSGVPMLHFEIREAGDSVDPSRLLPAK